MKTPRLVSLCFGILTLATLLHAEPPASTSKEDDFTEKMNALQQAVSELRSESYPLANAKPESLEKELARLTKLPVEEIHTLVEKGLQSADALVQAQALLCQAEFLKADLSFDEALSEKETDPKRLRQARFGKGFIACFNLDYASGQKHYQSGLSLIDKASEPLAWAKCADRLHFACMAQRKYSEAERLLREILRLHEENQEQPHAAIAEALHSLGLLFRVTARSEEAEAYMRRSLGILEANFGEDDPRIGSVLTNLSPILIDTERFEEAEEFLRRALAIHETTYGKDNPNVADVLCRLGYVLQYTKRPKAAEAAMRRSIAIFEDSFGKKSSNLPPILNNLGTLLLAMNRLEEAEQIMKQALQISEDTAGIDHPSTLVLRSNLGKIQKTLKK